VRRETDMGKMKEKEKKGEEQKEERENYGVKRKEGKKKGL
jgi:hypothetical protein